MPETLDVMLRFLYDEFPQNHIFSKISPSPVPTTPPDPWLLGTREKGAILAADKGMKYAFGHFMSDADGPAIVKKYREDFVMKNKDENPQTIIAVSVICAGTTEKAEELALSSLLWNVQQEKGIHDNGVPTVEEAKSYHYTDQDIKIMNQLKKNLIVGNPQEVKRKLLDLQQLYGADELMIVTITHSYEARKRSYQLL